MVIDALNRKFDAKLACLIAQHKHILENLNQLDVDTYMHKDDEISTHPLVEQTPIEQIKKF